MGRISVILSALLVATAVFVLLLPRLGDGLFGEGDTPGDAVLSGAFTLAVSWQPAFCETAPARPECAGQTTDRFDASHFSLHGLWPDPAGTTYCDVAADLRERDEAGHWRDLPRLDLSDGLRSRLEIVMPGARSALHRHEWVKHGTCSGADAETYYEASLALMAALNGSEVRELFARSIGQTVTVDAIRAAFDAAFGPSAGRRVQVECVTDRRRRLIEEIRISLSGEIGTPLDLAGIISAAPERNRGCPGGIVDPVGLQ